MERRKQQITLAATVFALNVVGFNTHTTTITGLDTYVNLALSHRQLVCNALSHQLVWVGVLEEESLEPEQLLLRIDCPHSFLLGRRVFALTRRSLSFRSSLLLQRWLLLLLLLLLRRGCFGGSLLYELLDTKVAAHLACSFAEVCWKVLIQFPRM